MVGRIREEEGNLRYEYFLPMDDPETVLLIDSWTGQAAIDAHHASPMMAEITALREKYDLHMKVERYRTDEEGAPATRPLSAGKAEHEKTRHTAGKHPVRYARV